ncbi:MAG: O-antigen polymerase [Thermoleophilia bacterium]|nr:O-antigen polymerase [Thermoleophilia bacterium]MCZ4496059.1 O-antigen polymerase [Thermoleophilia bacterium]
MALALLFSTGAVISLGISAQDIEAGVGNARNQMIWAALYLVSAVLLARSGHAWDVVARMPKSGWALLALIALSALWSVEPAETVRRVIALMGSTMIGLALGARFGPDGFLRAHGLAVALAVVASFAVAVMAPDLAVTIDERGDAFQGAFSHKTMLGLVMAWGVAATCLLAWGSRGGTRAAWTLVALASLALLAMSGSRTGMVVLALASAVCWGAILLRRRGSMLVVGIACIVLTVVVAVSILATLNWEGLTTVLGRDPTLTGRTTIWAAVIKSIEQRPMFGFGFAAFWGDFESPARNVWAELGFGIGRTTFRPTSSHSGWLDLWLQVGIVGVALYATTLAIALRRCLAAIGHHATPGTIACLLFVVYFTFSSLVDGTLVASNHVFWVALVAVLVQPEPREKVRRAGD